MTNSTTYVATVAVALGIGAAAANGQQVAWAENPTPASNGSDVSASPPEPPGSSRRNPSTLVKPARGSADGLAARRHQLELPFHLGATRKRGALKPALSSSNADPGPAAPPASEPLTADGNVGPGDGEPNPSGRDPKPPADDEVAPQPFLPGRHRALTRTQQPPKAAIAVAADPADQVPSFGRTGKVDVAIPGIETKAITADALQSTRLSTFSSPTLTSLVNLERQPVIAESVTMAPASALTAPRVVSNLLAAVGLAPLAANGPLAPVAPPPTLFAALEWVRREIEKTFANQSPTIAYNPAQNTLVDGSIVGKVTVSDPDSTVYTFTATQPADGEVVMNPDDGTFIYTPGPDYTGKDTFQVTVTDASSGFHIHGLSGLLNLITFGLVGESGHTATTTVDVGARFERTTVVSGLSSPTDFRFLPDNRILIAEKGGAIRVYNGSELQSEPLITMHPSTNWARGVNAIELDPNYAENGYVYVSYIGADNIQKLSRITVTDPSADVLVAEPGSEVSMVVGDQQAGNDHHGGALSFGPDGMLYWSTGDNVCCSVVDGSNSQNPTNMYGKVLRFQVNPDDTVTAAPGNPFDDGDGPNYDAIYATGFRNPFRLTFTPGGELLVTEVGQGTWEEVNLVTSGANYGWPNAEGPCNGIGTSSCATPSSYTNPIFTYNHNGGGASITAVLVYTGTEYGQDYQNSVFIADFSQGWIKQLTCNASYTSCGEALMFVPDAGKTVSLQQGPDGNIYQLSLDGTLSRITRVDEIPSVV